MSDKDNTDDKTAQDAPLTDEEAQSVQGGGAASVTVEARLRVTETDSGG
ncbi:MAG: hypothetical protein U0990_07215 [Candidatus Nanopelagicales bacterium]|nr:hypothetical protein [Candidatus Nanopelagicales bacterium]MDZ4249865.1 hypothetical protein [Candidatus Nanopelagicales bacterium]